VGLLYLYPLQSKVFEVAAGLMCTNGWDFKNSYSVFSEEDSLRHIEVYGFNLDQVKMHSINLQES
jgi:hypothetical protein